MTYIGLLLAILAGYAGFEIFCLLPLWCRITGTVACAIGGYGVAWSFIR